MLRPLVAVVPVGALVAGVLASAPVHAAPSVPPEKVTVQSSCYGRDLTAVPGRIRFTTRPAPGGTYTRARVSGVEGTRWRGGIVIDYEGDTSLSTPMHPKHGTFGQVVVSPRKHPAEVFAIYRKARRQECSSSVVGAGRAPMIAMGGPLGVLVRRGERQVLKVFPLFGSERARFRVKVRVTTPHGTQRRAVTKRADPQTGDLIKVQGLRHLRSFTRVKVTATKVATGQTSRLTLLRTPITG